jgi:ubiquinone/menaquinone biosynthesis C-methylase UbiE
LTALWVGAGITAGLGVLLWWLLIETEGVYLGQPVVTWLYDLFATRYDAIKEYETPYEDLLLATPIMNAIRPNRTPLMLDIATGTARLPVAMLAHAHFEGHIIGVDISRAMLRQAAYKLADDLAHVDLLHAPATCLPFDDDTFDGVTLLEAIEFIAQPHLAIHEAVRVLRPGGILLTTQRINIKTMPGKLWSEAHIQAALEQAGIERVIFEAWQEEYTKVWGRKAGRSQPVGVQPLEAVMRCPRCGYKTLTFSPPTFICSNCALRVPVGEDGVLEVRKAHRAC